jgi:hypothetical protein
MRKEKEVLILPMPAKWALYIDEGIKPLVVALNEWPEVETVASCEGHPLKEGYTKPYVSFKSERRSSVRTLKDRIKGTNWGIFANDKTVKTTTAVRETYWTIRPFKKRGHWESVQNVTELVKNHDYDGDLDITQITEFKWDPETGLLNGY